MNNANTKNQTPIRVLLFPWLAYGHITPYLELAKRLTTNSPNSFTTYICSTPATLICIKNKITKPLSQSIKLVPFILPTSPHLPQNLHTTNGLPPHLMSTLMEAFNSSLDIFSDILSDLKPDLLIYDCFQPWAPLIAKNHNIPAVHFITSSSTSTCFMYHHYTKPAVQFPFPRIHFRDYESGDRERMFENLSNEEEMSRVFQLVERSCEIVLVKGFRDIEGKYMDYVSSLVGKKFVPVGPLVQEPDPDERDEDHEILSWLDKKERKSTILVSFGSEHFLEKEDIDEVACGLELIGEMINFIWVLRFPKGESVNERKLPQGFVERVGNRGKILEWAPQTKILGHESIGGFVSHCGWNSVMESMSHGVPVIGVPVNLDQPINARLVEEVGVGVEVLKDGNKRIRRDALASVIKKVVIEDCGELVRRRAAEMREKLSKSNNGDEEIEQVVRELVGICNKSSAVKT